MLEKVIFNNKHSLTTYFLKFYSLCTARSKDIITSRQQVADKDLKH